MKQIISYWSHRNQSMNIRVFWVFVVCPMLLPPEPLVPLFDPIVPNRIPKQMPEIRIIETMTMIVMAQLRELQSLELDAIGTLNSKSLEMKPFVKIRLMFLLRKKSSWWIKIRFWLSDGTIIFYVTNAKKTNNYSLNNKSCKNYQEFVLVFDLIS